MLNLDVRPLVIVGFENMVMHIFSVKESAHMLTKLGLVIDFKDDLDSISLKKN